MSRPWNPDEDLARVRAAPRWPAGATAGVTMIGLTCVGLAILLYKLAGPRDIFGS